MDKERIVKDCEGAWKLLEDAKKNIAILSQVNSPSEETRIRGNIDHAINNSMQIIAGIKMEVSEGPSTFEEALQVLMKEQDPEVRERAINVLLRKEEL